MPSESDRGQVDKPVIISKIQCADHLLAVACFVYHRYGSCPAVVHLAGASAEMASAIVEHELSNSTGAAKSFFKSIATTDPAAMKEILRTRAWVKHANKDTEGRLDWHGMRYGNTAFTAELLLFVAAMDMAIAYGPASKTTRNVADVLRPRHPELAGRLDKAMRKLSQVPSDK